MELLKDDEIYAIIQQFGLNKALGWQLEEFSDKMIGYLGDHLKLTIEAESDDGKTELKLFVKCLPRFDEWKAQYLRDLNFFYKEYVMLSKLFDAFQNKDDSEKWRPKLLFIREDLFVFEDVTQLGYEMPYFKDTMTFEALKATVQTLARFHAQSYIYEETKSKQLGRQYRIWDDFSEYLQEPMQGKPWRDTGRNAVIDYLKKFSKYKSKPDFINELENTLPMLYEKALDIMKPSNEYRNVVIHRDLWSNNIFIKDLGNSELHALIIDFQTILYSSPMLDLSSLIYFNTTKSDRDSFSLKLIDVYHNKLSEVLEEAGVNTNVVFPKDVLMKAYNDSLIFGMTQASIIVPIIAMCSKKKEEIFCDPVKSIKANVVSRSEEFIEIAIEDSIYHNRVSELLDEIVETFIYPNEKNTRNGFTHIEN